MQFLLALFVALLCTVQAAPISKRFYRPSSEVFSVIAHHEGAVFQYNLLKWDGEDLVLNADEQAFFGRVRASQGYVLNLPITSSLSNSTKNKTAQTSAESVNVHVDPVSYKLSTTKLALNSTHGFGISQQKLTYKNSTEFLACPEYGFRGEYLVYWGNHNKTVCPNKAQGYQIELIVQTDAYVDYNPTSNNRTSSVFGNLKRRLLGSKLK